jgi:hypothetical protein
LVGCPDKDKYAPDSTIKMVNNTSNDVARFVEFRNIGDTILPNISPFPSSENVQINLIKANSSVDYPDTWKGTFKRTNQILMVFLFSKDTIEQIPWNQIRDKYLILRRYDLTLDSLEKRNWTIEYP